MGHHRSKRDMVLDSISLTNYIHKHTKEHRQNKMGNKYLIKIAEELSLGLGSKLIEAIKPHVSASWHPRLNALAQHIDTHPYIAGAAGLATTGAALHYGPKAFGVIKNVLSPGIGGTIARTAMAHPIATAAGIGGAGMLAGNMMSNRN